MSLRVAIVDNAQARGSIAWGEQIGGLKVYPCHQAQLDILGSKKKYTAAFFGTGCGKTAIVPLYIYKKLDKHIRSGNKRLFRALIVSPSAPTFESSQLRQHLRGVFDNSLYTGVWYEQKKVYTGPGYEIVVRTAEDDYQRISGGQFDVVVLDEAWQIKNVEVWEECVRRINIYDGSILLVTTPNVDGWLRTKLMTPFLEGDPDFYVRQAHTRENPAKSPEQHERFLATELIKLGKAKYDRMYGGQFSAITGLVYPAFADEKGPLWPVIPRQKLPSPAVRAFGDLDWGYYPDALSAHINIECVNGIIYTVEELYGTKMQIDFVGRALRAMQDRWSLVADSQFSVHGGFFDAFYCDASRPESRDMVRRFGVSIRNRKVADVDAGISMVDQMYNVGRLKIMDNCTWLIKQSQNYSWDKNGKAKGYLGDHSLDDQRYGVSSYMLGRPITLLPDEAAPVDQVANAIRLGQIESVIEARAIEADSARNKVLQHQLAMMNADDGN